MNLTLKGFLKKELSQVLRDRRMRVVLFGVPVIQMMVFGLALSNEVRNVRLAVYAAPSDELAHRVAQRALASGWFVPARGPDAADPFRAVQSGKADAALVSPPGGLADAVARGEGRLQLLVDASNALRAQGIETYMNAILRQTMAEDRGGPLPAPVSFNVRVLYNPSMKSAVYLVPGVMCMILCLVTILLTSMSLAREKEMGTFETLISAPITTGELLLGKTLPYVLLGLIDVPLVLGVAVGLFHVPMRGAFWELGLAALVFVCTTVSIGTLISTIAATQQQAMMGGFLFLFPAIQLSGIIAPLENIPGPMQWITYLNPLRYFVILLRNILLKGGDPWVFWTNLGSMALLAVVCVTISVRRFHKTIR